MININGISKYLQSLQEEKENNITNIFLANSQNEILISLIKKKTNEYSIMGTLLNDSLYILKLNLADDQGETKQTDSEPIEIIIENQQDQVMFLYNIENHFIYGVSVKKQQMAKSRNVVKNSYKQIKQELMKTIRWMDIDKDNY